MTITVEPVTEVLGAVPPQQPPNGRIKPGVKLTEELLYPDRAILTSESAPPSPPTDFNDLGHILILTVKGTS